MIIYSEKIIVFILHIKKVLRRIIKEEVGLRVSKERFYDKEERFSYPIKVVIYEHKSMLGYFNSEFYEMGFHECLMRADKKQLENIIRHEFAHYLTFVKYGVRVQAHGNLFREICKNYGWGPDVYEATIQLSTQQEVLDEEVNSVLRKVQKLMALSTSSNSHEAEQATIKSQQLLLKHNIDRQFNATQDSEKLVLKRVLSQKKENAKLRSIAQILETFLVNIVYNRDGRQICLEILGSAVNVEIAEYVAAVLDKELDNLWETAKKMANMKGLMAKNSFFLGISTGYLNKMHFLRRSYASDAENALVLMEKKLEDAKSMVYTRLTSSRSSGGFCPSASALGQSMGHQLNINPGIHRSPTRSTATLIHMGK